MAAELEAKLNAPAEYRLPDLEGVRGLVPGEPVEARLEASYYDTAELRLLRFGATLRHRDDEGWVLKLPQTGASSRDAVAREEIHFPGPAGRPPAAALKVLKGLLGGAQLRLVATLSTFRHRLPLIAPDGQKVVEVVDDEVSVLHRRRVGHRFRQLEVEVTDPVYLPELRRVVKKLVAAGAVPDPQQTTKVQLAVPERAAELAAPVAADGPPTVATVLKQALRSSLDRLLARDPAIRSGAAPEDVHQARVAVRRLRSDLKTFAAWLELAPLEELSAELRWLGGLLGAVRDREVLQARLQSYQAALPAEETRGLVALVNKLQAEIDENRAALLRAIDSKRYLALLTALERTAAEPPLSGDGSAAAAELAGKVLDGPWRRLRSEVRRAPGEPSDEALHAIRIRAKRTRYAAEALEPVGNGQLAKFARAVAQLQEVLGEHQDSVAAREWLRQVQAGRRASFVAGEVAALEAARGAESRQKWRPAWKEVKRKRPR